MYQIISTIGNRFFLLFLSLIGSIISTRYLGPEGRGLFFYWSSSIVLVSQFGNLGLHASNIYLFSKKKVDISLLASNSVLISLISGIFFSSILIFVSLLIGREEISSISLLIPIYVVSIMELNSYFFSNLLVALNKINKFNYSEFLGRSIPIFISIYISIIYASPVKLIWGLCLSSIITFLINIYFLSKYIRIRIPNISVFFLGAKYSFKSYLTCLVSGLSLKINIFIIQPFVSAIIFGQWSLGIQIFEYLSIIPASIALVVLPKMMRQDNPKLLLKSYRKYTLITMFFISLIFIFFGKVTLIFLYGEEYSVVYRYILFALPGLIFYSLMAITSQFLASVGYPIKQLFIWLVVILIQVLFSKFTLSYYGPEGAMIGLSISFIVGYVFLNNLSKIYVSD